jgi:dihydrofolate synthase/folylpolyglutamate synthase
VLCSVGLDHRDWLGDTLDAIGAEKAGIFRAGRPAVLGTSQMPPSVFAAAESIGARLAIAERDFSWSMESGRWSYRGLAARLDDLPPPALAGRIQYRNAATALAAHESLGGSRGLDVGRVTEALRAVRLPGRFQTVRLSGPRSTAADAVEWILDVSHNEPAAQVLEENLCARRPTGRTYAVCSILRDKDVEAIGRAIAPAIDDWIVCGAPGTRGSTARELAARLAGTIPTPRLADTVREGLNLARSLADAGDRVVVFGSFTTVTSALEWLGEAPGRESTRPEVSSPEPAAQAGRSDRARSGAHGHA